MFDNENVHAHINKCAFIPTHTRMHTYMHKYIHTHTHTHTHIYTCLHTHTFYGRHTRTHRLGEREREHKDRNKAGFNFMTSLYHSLKQVMNCLVRRAESKHSSLSTSANGR